ncbi:MAG: alpha-glucan family phosphorylase, partial [Cyclobacteriaceae bacterium]
RIIKRPPEAFVEPAEVNEPDWKSILVEFKVPESLKDLETLSQNLWWSWNHEAIELFRSIDGKLWDKVNHNPVSLLHEMPYNRLHELEQDARFIERLEHVMERFNAYMNVPKSKSGPKIAYLCMEYGLHVSLPMYSGGLGILAGDHLKEASDKNVDLLGIGLIYRYGYFNQSLTLRGDQVPSYDQLRFTQLPIHPVNDKRGNRLIINVPLRGPMLYVQVWRVDVGRVPLYLFDTDIPENNDEYKAITHQLYGGDQLNRFRQELLIALCSITLFRVLKIDVDLFHYNEGHTAFTGLARIMQMISDEHLSFDEAAHFVHASTLFTTHTPVPAGHDAFSEDILRSYHGHFAEELNVSWEQLLSIGKINRLDPNEKFSMSYYAARSSEEINGVSKVHAEVTRKMFRPIWKGFFEEELKIKYVTNGAHYQTWAAPAWQELFKEIAGNNFLQELSDLSHWEKIKEVPDDKIWEIRKKLKNDLIKGVGRRLKVALQGLHTHPKQVYEMLHNLKNSELIIGFARRFASYKRGNLLFRDTQRLKRILNDPQKPVKLIFAGKAHPANKEAQKLIKTIVKLSQSPDFLGKIFFIQNYDMELAQLMVKGVDVWLNTPVRGLEASGTSGMKATFNGVLNFSVMDGWWAEAYREDAGWALPQEGVYEKQKDQDDLDAEMIYNILEHEIIPEYYESNDSGVPRQWINRIKNAVANIAPHYTSRRMLSEYQTKFYQPMHKRTLSMKENDYKVTKEMTKWVNRMKREWPKISVVDVSLSNGTKPVQLGEKFQAEVTLDLNNLPASDIGVELVFAKNAENGELRIKDVQELDLVEEKPHKVVYRGASTATLSGAYKYDIRFYPKNPQLHYRRVLPLVKWI